MPYRIKQKGDEFQVVNSDTGDVKGTHPTRRQAVAQLRALYANTKDAGGKPAKKKKSSGRSLDDEHKMS